MAVGVHNAERFLVVEDSGPGDEFARAANRERRAEVGDRPQVLTALAQHRELFAQRSKRRDAPVGWGGVEAVRPRSRMDRSQAVRDPRPTRRPASRRGQRGAGAAGRTSPRADSGRRGRRPCRLARRARGRFRPANDCSVPCRRKERQRRGLATAATTMLAASLEKRIFGPVT